MACSAYKFHVPSQPSSDSHHVIPRAWQRFWHPTISPATPTGTRVATWDLWDPRTVELCPSCHRGVHERIVALMHGKPRGRDRLWGIAQLALDRFTAAGGSLDALRAAREWGEQ